MNTTITIQVVKAQHSTTDIQDAIENAFGEFDRIVELYTRFEETSELSQLNASAGQWTKVSAEFFQLIEFMVSISQITDNVFDPTVIDLLEAYGYSAKYDFEDKLAAPDLVQSIQRIVETRPTATEIELDKKRLRVRLREGQRLDLGSTGKGYAIDCAASHLEKFGNYLIDAGGDIRCQGNNERGEKWKVGLKHFVDGEAGFIGKLELSSGSLCSSGSWARQVGKFHHLINSATGQPESKTITSYVYGPQAQVSDAWSTVLFLMGAAGLKLLPDNYAGLVITQDQKLTKSEDFPSIMSINHD